MKTMQAIGKVPKRWVKEAKRPGIKASLCRMVEKRVRRQASGIIAEHLADDSQVMAELKAERDLYAAREAFLRITAAYDAAKKAARNAKCHSLAILPDGVRELVSEMMWDYYDYD